MTNFFQIAPGDHVSWGAGRRLLAQFRYTKLMEFQPHAAMARRLRAKPMRGEEKQ
jgi:hypothetical protein